MRLILFAALCAAVACGGDSTSPTPFAGTYTLQSVDGQPLPFVINQQAGFVLLSDQLTIADSGTWTETSSVQVTQNGQTHSQGLFDTRTWLRTGSTLSLHSTRSDTVALSGSFSTNRLDLGDGTFTFVYTK